MDKKIMVVLINIDEIEISMPKNHDSFIRNI
jgi:hypothetical protein